MKKWGARHVAVPCSIFGAILFFMKGELVAQAQFFGDDGFPWKTVEDKVQYGGASKALRECGLSAWFTDGKGTPVCGSTVLELYNPTDQTIYYGLSGVVNLGVRPNEVQVMPLAIYRSAKDTDCTSVPIVVRCFDGSLKDGGMSSTATAVTTHDKGTSSGPVSSTALSSSPSPFCETYTWMPRSPKCRCQPRTEPHVDPKNYSRQRCECEPGLRWDTSSRVCTPCATGSTWNAERKECSAICPAGTTSTPDGRTCACDAPGLWSSARARCTCSGGRSWTGNNCACPSDRPAWDSTSQTCRVCGGGGAWNGTACVCPPQKPFWDGNACNVPPQAPPQASPKPSEPSPLAQPKPSPLASHPSTLNGRVVDPTFPCKFYSGNELFRVTSEEMRSAIFQCKAQVESKRVVDKSYDYDSAVADNTKCGVHAGAQPINGCSGHPFCDGASAMAWCAGGCSWCAPGYPGGP